MVKFFWVFLFARHKCYKQYTSFFHCIVKPCFFIEVIYQKFTNGQVIKGDTVGKQNQESTMYLLKTAVVGLTFVVTVLFVSYACLGILMKRNRATHEDLVIINEWYTQFFNTFTVLKGHLGFHCAYVWTNRRKIYIALYQYDWTFYHI